MKRIITVQDISCVGKCSLTVALPIISAAGVEASVLPTAVLSTHTAFLKFTFKDLTDEIKPISDTLKELGIDFDAIYTGYLGSFLQLELVEKFIADFKRKDTVVLIDPVMADNGKLYPGFDTDYVKAMLELSKAADYIIPNITEAAFLAGVEYKSKYDKEYIDLLINTLVSLGCKNIILTGVSYREGKTGILVYENGKEEYYEHELLKNGCHGTGDIYASALVGAMCRKNTAIKAAEIAARFTVDAIKATALDPSHWYGARFECVLSNLIEYLK